MRAALLLAALGTGLLATSACSLLFGIHDNLGPEAPEAGLDVSEVGLVDSSDADAGAEDHAAGDADATADVVAEAAPRVTWCTMQMASDPTIKFCADFDELDAGTSNSGGTIDDTVSLSPPSSLKVTTNQSGPVATAALPSGQKGTATINVLFDALGSGSAPHVLQLDFADGSPWTCFLFLYQNVYPYLVEYVNSTAGAVQQVQINAPTPYSPGAAWQQIVMTLSATTCTANVVGFGSGSITLMMPPANRSQARISAGIQYESAGGTTMHLDNVTLAVGP